MQGVKKKSPTKSRSLDSRFLVNPCGRGTVAEGLDGTVRTWSVNLSCLKKQAYHDGKKDRIPIITPYFIEKIDIWVLLQQEHNNSNNNIEQQQQVVVV